MRERLVERERARSAQLQRELDALRERAGDAAQSPPGQDRLLERLRELTDELRRRDQERSRPPARQVRVLGGRVGWIRRTGVLDVWVAWIAPRPAERRGVPGQELAHARSQIGSMQQELKATQGVFGWEQQESESTSGRISPGLEAARKRGALTGLGLTKEVHM